MNFETIARKAYERQDYVRAVVTLSQGLKRLDDVDCEAFDLLIDIYANSCKAPGLEREVASVVSRHFDASLIGGQIIACLDARDLFQMSRAFEREMASYSVRVQFVSIESLTQPPESFEPEPSAPLYDETSSEQEDIGASAESAELVTPTSPDDIESPPASLHTPTPEDRSGIYPAYNADADESVAEGEDSEVEDTGGRFDTDVNDILEPPRQIEWTDEVSREDEPVADYSEEEPQVAQSSTATRKPRRLMRVSLGVVLICVLCVLGLSLCSAPQGTQIKAMEQQLEAFDTVNPNAFELLMVSEDADQGKKVLERQEFIRMLLAMEKGDVLPTSRVLGSEGHEELGPWGRGALVWMALQRRDLEAALAHVEAMERKFPEQLATLWTRARLDEMRGRFWDAHKVYSRALALYPRFLAGLMGQVRVSYLSGQVGQLEKDLAQLREVNPGHVYLKIRADLWTSNLMQWREPSEAQESAAELKRDYSKIEAGQGDRFARAYDAYVSAVVAYHRGDLTQAYEDIRESLGLEPFMSPALLLQGVVLTSLHRVDEASLAFARYASIEQLDELARLALMVHAPRALTEVGRPDLSLIFALDPGGPESARRQTIIAQGEDTLKLEEQWRPVSLELTTEQRQRYPVAMQQAMSELCWALLELGAAQDVLQLMRYFEDKDQPSVQALTWFAYYMLDASQKLHDIAYQRRDTPTAQFPSALALLLEYKFVAGFRAVSGNDELSPIVHRSSWLRLVTRLRQAVLPSEDVLKELDQSKYVSMPSMAGRMRARVWAQYNPKDARYLSVYESQSANDVKGFYAFVDMSYVQMWQGDLKRAQTYLASAKKIAAEHPEVLYLELLLSSVSGDVATSRALDKKLELSRRNPVFILDLAELALRYQNPALARSTLTGLKQSSWPDAIWMDRMGSIMRQLPSEGMIDILRGMLAQHQSDSLAPTRAEILKWIAVLSGVRQGKDGSLYWIDEAFKVKPAKQGELWLEKGYYFKSKKQNDKAQDSFLKALRYNSSLAEAHLGLARISQSEGRKEQERTHYIRYLELTPYGKHSVEVRQLLDSLQSTGDHASQSN